MLTTTGGTVGYVCWGLGTTSSPALNDGCGRLNKYEQGKTIERAGIRSIRYLSRAEALKTKDFPLFGRTFSHRAGRDITIALQPSDVEVRNADFYTVFEPFQTEWRVWMYRSKHLGSYEKVLNRPELYRKPGRNYRNGWAFQLVRSDSLNEDAIEIARNALRALELDFGGIDIGKTIGGECKIIEVNTAPAVESADRQVLRRLAHHINLWEENGFPKRKKGEWKKP